MGKNGEKIIEYFHTKESKNAVRKKGVVKLGMPRNSLRGGAVPCSLISQGVKIPPVLFTRIDLYQLCESMVADSKRAEVYVIVSITNDMLRNKREGLTPSKAIRSFILACNERGAIAKSEVQDARYKDSHNISKMR